MRKLSNITESLWSDIQDRNSGEVMRKEDDVNLMGAEEFAEYLKQHYELKTPNNLEITVSKYVECIDFPIIDNSDSPGKKSLGFSYDRCSIYYEDTNNKIKSMRICFVESSRKQKEDIIQVLKDKYYLDRVFVGNGDRVEYKIFPKENKDSINNSFVLEVIDFVSDNIQAPYKKTLFKK